MRRLAPLLALPIVLSCGSDAPTAATPFSGTFDLATINGGALPHLDLIAAFTNDTLYIIGGEVRVLSRGRAAVVRSTRWHTTSNGVAPATHDTTIVTWRSSGDTAFLDYAKGGPAGAYTDTAIASGSTLRVRTLVNRFAGGVFHRDQAYTRR